MPATRQLAPWTMFGLWGALVAIFILVAQFAGHDYRLNQRSFLAASIAFALFLAVLLFFAARGVTEKLAGLGGPGIPWLLAISLFLIFLIYALGTGAASLTRLVAIAGFAFVPLALLASAQNSAPGCWQDLATVVLVWTCVKFAPSHWIWPYPGGRLAYIFTVLLAVNVAIAGFLLLRRTKNVGYSIAWGANWILYVLGSLALFAAIAIPLGIKIHFIQFEPRLHEWKMFVPLSIGILFFTAWPEEFLFRGLLQNLLSRATHNETAGWIAASILFGFSHITNMHFPNWRYVLLATIAGLFYGWTWRKTGSIFASALVHGGVDILWHFLFFTP